MKHTDLSKPTKHKYGDTREDGYRFSQYYRRSETGRWLELWRTPAWFDKLPQYQAKQRSNPEHRKKAKATGKRWRDESYSTSQRMLNAANQRAKSKGLPFSLTLEDIVVPKNCPALGIPLRRGEGCTHDGSPQLDRLVPELGYVKGNVAVISKLANTIKQNASPKQIRAVADWFEKSLRSLTP